MGGILLFTDVSHLINEERITKLDHCFITPNKVMNLSIELIAANITKRGTTRHHKPPNRKIQCLHCIV